MSKLTTQQRNHLPDSAFALPGRRYPVHDRGHAQAALARVAEFGTPGEKAAVHAAIARRFPDMMHDGSKPSAGLKRGTE